MKPPVPIIPLFIAILSTSSWQDLALAESSATPNETKITKKKEAQTRIQGIMIPQNQVTIKSSIQGVIQRIRVKEGSLVSENQILAIIDDEQAKIELEAAKLDEKEWERRTKSAEASAGVISKTELESTKYEFQKKSNSRALKENQLSKTRIRTPIAGIVAAILARKGEMAEVGTTLFQIVDDKHLKIEIRVPADLARNFPIGATVNFALGEKKSAINRAKVEFISPIVNSEMNTVRMTLNIMSNKNLVPGDVAWVEFPEL